METQALYSNRFQTVRVPSSTTALGRPNFLPKTEGPVNIYSDQAKSVKSPLKNTKKNQEHKSKSPTPKGRSHLQPQPTKTKQKKISPFRLWYSLTKLLCIFYALLVTCFRFITKKCLPNITCQNEQAEKSQHEAGENCNKTEQSEPVPAVLQQIQRNNSNNFRGDVSSKITNPFPERRPKQLYSSDDSEEEVRDTVRKYEAPKYILTHEEEECDISQIDDYEIPFVRFFDNIVYYIGLYSINYPAFQQEILNQFQSRGCRAAVGEQEDSKSRVFGHNLDPKKKRPELMLKGIEFLKRHKLKRKMSRVHEDAHKRWVLKISLASRLLIFFMQFVLVNFPPFLKHQNDGFKFTPEDTYGKLLDGVVNSTMGGYINWDAHFFLHISVYGYTSENIMAFFPLLPLILYFPSRVINFVFGGLISLSSIVIIVGVLFNIWLFVKCTENIYEISKFRPQASRSLITTASIMFCFNPASIFFSGLYTETLFAYLTSSVLLALLRKQYGLSAICAALSCLCRSNGIFNVGFILAFQLQNELRYWKEKGFRFVGFCMQSLGIIAVTLLPFMLYQLYGIWRFCDNGKVFDDPSEVPLYCVKEEDDWLLGIRSLPYSYIQKKYWNVGFLEYFQFKQIPNFILAAPVLLVLGTQSWTTTKLSIMQMANESSFNGVYALFHAIHGLFLTFLCFFFIHVQVSTRLIMAACPYLYVYLAAAHENEVDNFRRKRINLPIQSLGVILWFSLYYVVGTIGFSLGLPWT